MSERPIIKAMGFYLYFFFPCFAFFFVTFGNFSPPPPTPVTVPAVFYPIGLVFLTIYPPLIYKPGLPVAGTSYLKFAEGAWYAGIAIAFLSLVQAAVLSLLFNQAVIGFSFAAVSIGSIWLPAAPGATGLSMFLSGRGLRDSQPPALGPSRFRVVDSAFLALFLGKFKQFARSPLVPTTFAALLFLYLLGWIEISFNGGYPFTIFGVVMPILLFASCYITIHRTLNPTEVPKVANSLPVSPAYPMPSASNVLVRVIAFIAFLSVLSFLLWLWRP